MIKKYIINQLTEISAWIGVCVVIASIIFPRSLIMFLGIFLILTSDKYILELIGKISPSIKLKIEKWRE